MTEKAVSLRAGAELFSFSLGQTSAAGVGNSDVSIERIVDAQPIVTLPKLQKKGTNQIQKQYVCDFQLFICEMILFCSFAPV